MRARGQAGVLKPRIDPRIFGAPYFILVSSRLTFLLIVDNLISLTVIDDQTVSKIPKVFTNGLND